MSFEAETGRNNYRRRRRAAQFSGQQQIERLRQGQRLSGIAANLNRFRGQ
jgi:hypothetical protein